MPEATLKHVAKLAGVAPVTVSRVVNGSENVAAGTREKVLAIIRTLDYTPNIHAANLSRKKLNDESESRLRAGFLFTPEERKALAQQLSRIRRDLDRLKKHTECIQSCVEILQEVYSR
jgi:DNA-binding LacI/PurR family transcriptional regulator